MYLKRLLYGKYSKYVISAILGIGLATLFRKVCNDRNCLIFKGPKINLIEKKVFKHNNKCYKFKHESCSCNNNKKIVNFA